MYFFLLEKVFEEIRKIIIIIHAQNGMEADRSRKKKIEDKTKNLNLVFMRKMHHRITAPSSFLR